MLQPVYHCGVGQAFADLKAVSDQMFIDGGGYVPADKSVIVYVHGVITDTAGTGLFNYPQFLPGGAFSLMVKGFTSKYTDEIICTTTSTTIGASNFTFKDLKFSGGIRALWLIGGENKGHDNCYFDNSYQSHYEVEDGFMRNNIIVNVGYAALSGYSNNPAKPMIIEDNIVYGTAGGYSCFAQPNAIIRRNYLTGGGHAISCQQPIAGITKIYNNFITGATGSAIHLFASSSLNQGYGIYNNTIYNCAYGIAANYTPNEQNFIKNNLIFVGAGQYGFQLDADNLNQFIDYNFYDIDAAGFCAQIHNGSIWQYFATLASMKAAYPAYELHGVQGAAEFMLPGSTSPSDYKIKPTSGAKNIGLDLSAIFTADYFNKSRPKGAAFDCGFHEEATIGLTGSLNKYSFIMGEYVIASATVVGTATGVMITINGKTFPLVNQGSGSWTATIKSADIGVCAGAAVVLTAFNDDYVGSTTLPTITIAARTVGNYDIEAIAQGINALMIQIPEIKTALSYEPRTIDRLPATTIFFDGFNQTQTEAESYTIHYRYNLRVYVKLHDDQESQQQLNDIVGKILEVLKANKSFLDCVLFGQAASGITAAILDKNNPVLLAEIAIDAMKEED